MSVQFHDVSKIAVLLVDDTHYNLKILQKYLQDESYELESVDNGNDAIKLLDENPERFDCVLLDRIMPDPDGMEVLKWIKSDDRFKTLPIVLQTSKSSEQDILEGLTAGANYYLTKPYSKEKLIAIVRSAIQTHLKYKSFKKEFKRGASGPTLMTHAKFKFRTLQEANDIGVMLSNACPDTNRVSTGLSELLLNAIEHGNLGITYELKASLLREKAWVKEVEKRLDMPEYKDKYATAEFIRNDNHIKITIEDMGNGFDWKKYFEFDPSRLYDSNGRGIFMAKSVSLDGIEYKGKGNIVEITINT